MTERLTFKCARDGEWWVALCVEINIGTQAKTLDELLVECDRMIHAHFETAVELNADPWRIKPDNGDLAAMAEGVTFTFAAPLPPRGT